MEFGLKCVQQTFVITVTCRLLPLYAAIVPLTNEQESPAVADKPARRENMPKIAPIRRAYNVVADDTGLSFYLHSFSCCCVRNLRNPEKFSENSNL